jgi:hypothetical protein
MPSGSGRPGQTGGGAAFDLGVNCVLGYHRDSVTRQASFRTWVRTWSKRRAFAGAQRICCFFTNGA